MEPHKVAVLVKSAQILMTAIACFTLEQHSRMVIRSAKIGNGEAPLRQAPTKQADHAPHELIGAVDADLVDCL